MLEAYLLLVLLWLTRSPWWFGDTASCLSVCKLYVAAGWAAMAVLKCREHASCYAVLLQCPGFPHVASISTVQCGLLALTGQQ